MYINEYKNLSCFSNQYSYLKEYFKNPFLSTDKLKQEIKDYFNEFISNTKITNSKEFYQFYQLLLDQGIFYPNLQKNILTILNTSHIDAKTLVSILNECDESHILSNSKIQNRLIHFVIKDYDAHKLEIIERYISKEFRDLLFLLQIEYRLQMLLKKQDLKFCYTFITLLLHDLKHHNELNIEYKGSGGYKDVFQIGDYLLQIGEGPHINEFPKTSRICAPILFKVYQNTQISISIILNPKTTQEERQNCWIKACEDQVILLDAKKENFGQYENDYIHPFKDISEQGKKHLGIDKFDLSDTKKGEVKYLDIDFYISSREDSYENRELEKKFYSYYKDFEHQHMKKNHK